MRAPSLRRFSMPLGRLRCCPPPGVVIGLSAGPGGGSGEVSLQWDLRPVTENVMFYRVYRAEVSTGQYRILGIVTDAAAPIHPPGRLGFIDADGPFAQRCYVVSAVSTRGLEGQLSAEVCGSSVGPP